LEGRKNRNGQSNKKLRADVGAELKTMEMAKMATNVDEHHVGSDEVATTAAQHLQVKLKELLQNTIEYKDSTYEDNDDNHFLTAKVKEELGDFFQ
jgi:hypothetical protein